MMRRRKGWRVSFQKTKSTKKREEEEEEKEKKPSSLCSVDDERARES
tara:strand:- start:63 stop:203 length:141 start_codon:yes stop_codon:yes gene_type:complete